MRTRLTLLGLLFVNSLFVFSCKKLTEQQRNDVSKNNIELQQVIAHAEKLYGKLKTVKERAADGLARLKRGEISKDVYNSLRAAWESEEVGIKLQIKAGTDKAKAIVARNKAINDAGVSWWQILLYSLPGIVAGGLGIAERQFKLKGAVKIGKEFGTAFGAVSRALDAVGGDGLREAMAVEIERAPGLTEDIMRPLHHRATAREL